MKGIVQYISESRVIRTAAQEKSAKIAFARMCAKNDKRIKSLIDSSDKWMSRVHLSVNGDKVSISANFYGHTYEFNDTIEKLFKEQVNESSYKNPFVEYEGRRYNENGARKIILNNAEIDNCKGVLERIDALIEWASKNFTVKHDVIVSNAIEKIVYNDFGVYNDHIQKHIDDTIKSYVADRRLDPWMYYADDEE